MFVQGFRWDGPKKYQICFLFLSHSISTWIWCFSIAQFWMESSNLAHFESTLRDSDWMLQFCIWCSVLFGCCMLCAMSTCLANQLLDRQWRSQVHFQVAAISAASDLDFSSVHVWALPAQMVGWSLSGRSLIFLEWRIQGITLSGQHVVYRCDVISGEHIYVWKVRGQWLLLLDSSSNY